MFEPVCTHCKWKFYSLF